MQDNINNIQYRDNILNNLNDRTNALSQSSKQFQKSTNQLVNKFWWKNYKIWIVLIGFLVFLVLVGRIDGSGKLPKYENWDAKYGGMRGKPEGWDEVGDPEEMLLNEKEDETEEDNDGDEDDDNEETGSAKEEAESREKDQAKDQKILQKTIEENSDHPNLGVGESTDLEGTIPDDDPNFLQDFIAISEGSDSQLEDDEKINERVSRMIREIEGAIRLREGKLRVDREHYLMWQGS